MHSTIERMDGCGDSIEVIAVPLKERIAGTCFFLEINILLLKEFLKQWLTASLPVEINTSLFKEWMTFILSVTKTEKVAVLDKQLLSKIIFSI